MKFNLKNFPKTIEGENRDAADLWADGFEKELRDNKRVIEKSQQIVGYPIYHIALETLEKFIKEILGE